jgi:hypothetical protein
VVQFENSVNHNKHERISRKDAKAQRKTASLLCAFAPLRETFLSAYETDPLPTTGYGVPLNDTKKRHKDFGVLVSCDLVNSFLCRTHLLGA